MGCIKEIEGCKMYLEPSKPGISLELARKGGREFPFMWILRKECVGMDVAYDVGCNLGYTTIPLSKSCKKVYAFEPDKRSYKLAKRNIDLNNLENVELIRKAVSDHCLEGAIYLSSKPNQTSMVAKVGKKKKVECVTLDTYARFKDPSVFIKMDIEGAEVSAIRGAKKIFESSPVVKILMELHPDTYGPKNDFREMVGDLKAMGFKIKYVVNAKGMRDLFKKYKLVPRMAFPSYERAVYDVFPEAEKWLDKIIGGKKVVRSVLWVKE